MKHLAFLGFVIATLMVPIQVQARQCVTFQGPPNPEAELRYILSHPGVVVCPSPGTTQYEQLQGHWKFLDGWCGNRPC
jgi:hypothetical protein